MQRYTLGHVILDSLIMLVSTVSSCQCAILQSVTQPQMCPTQAQEGLLLLVHGEVTDGHIDMFDREREFIQQKLVSLVHQLPHLRIVMEHITTKDAAEFVASAPSNVAASITPQHIILNRNALFQVLHCCMH